MNSKIPAIIAVASLILATSAVAQTTIVDFTATNTSTPSTTTSSPRAKTTDTTSGDTWAFSDTTALFAANGGQNDRIYGGVNTVWVSTSYNPTFTIGGATDPRRIVLQIHSDNTTGPTTPASATGMYIWNKDDFLNGADTATVALDTNSSMSINLQGNSGITRDIRFVVNQGGTYYVSETTKNTTGTGAFSLSSPSTINWAPIDTTTYAIGSYSSLVMNNIQAIGLYFNFTTNSASQQIFFSMDDFQASASLTAIPEPSTYAALAGLGALGLVIWRRRRAATTV